MKHLRFFSLLLVFSMIFSITYIASAEPADDGYFTEFTDTGSLSPLCDIALSTATPSDAKWNSYRYLAQECVPKEDISGVKLYFTLSGNATVHVEIRKEVNGNSLSSVNKSISGNGTADWYDFSLDSPVKITKGESYYIVYWLTSRDGAGVCTQSAFRPAGGGVKYPAYTSYPAQNKTSRDLTSKRLIMLPFKLETAFNRFEDTTDLSYYCNVALSTATSADPNWPLYGYMGQKFIADDDICGVELYLCLNGTATLNLEVRSAVNSGKIAEASASISGKGEKKWYTLRLDKTALTPGKAYYLAWYTSTLSSGGYCKQYAYVDPSIKNHAYIGRMSNGGTATSLKEIADTCVPFRVIGYGDENLSFTDLSELSELCYVASYGATTENCTFCNSCRYMAQEFVAGSDDFKGMEIYLSLNGSAKLHFEIRENINSAVVSSVEKTITGSGQPQWYTITLGKALAVTKGKHYFAVWYLAENQYNIKVSQYSHRLSDGTAVCPAYTSLLAEKGTPTTLKSKGLVVVPFRVISSRTPFTSFDPSLAESRLCDLYVKGRTSSDPLWTSYRYVAQEFVPDDRNLSGFRIYLALSGKATLHLEIRKDLNGNAIESTDMFISGNGENAGYDILFRENIGLEIQRSYYAVWYLTDLSAGGSCGQYCHRFAEAGEAMFPTYTSYPASSGTDKTLSSKATATMPFSLITNNYSSLYGDVFYDGAVNALDALLTLKTSIGSYSVGYRQFKEGDVDANNKINATDALMILQKSIDIVDSFPVENIPPKDSKEQNRYLDIMDAALSAYTYQDILDYLETVKTDGITEHGFGRLTANMGILIAHGYRPEYKDIFREMMTVCCEQMPTCKDIAAAKGAQAGNDFALKEIIFALLELDESDIFSQTVINGWRSALGNINPKTCYNVISPTPPQNVGNWAAYNSASEVLRDVAGLGSDSKFLDNQLGSVLLSFDQNGMYIDPHEPMLYDLAARQQIAICLFCGYDGIHKSELEEQLIKSAEATLYMQSACGEIAYGGRSNQFTFNEAIQTSLFEYYANYYTSLGNTAKAGEYKKAAELSADSINYWLTTGAVSHVKNHFAVDEKYGYEGYAYFNKYMITVASFIYVAYLFSDSTILTGKTCPAISGKYVFSTTDTFHKTFMGFNGYSAEIEYKADTTYDATGLGRIHKNGAPPAICLSLPGGLGINMSTYSKRLFSIAPGIYDSAKGKYYFGYDADATWSLKSKETNDNYVKTAWNVTLGNGTVLTMEIKISQNGVDITASGAAEVIIALPAFTFDGQNHTQINSSAHNLSVTYQGWTCSYSTAGALTKTSAVCPTRNGLYDKYNATGSNSVSVNIKINKN